MRHFRIASPLAIVAALLVGWCFFGCSSGSSSSAHPGGDDDGSPDDDDNDASPADDDDDDNDDSSPPPAISWVDCSEFFTPQWMLLIPPHTKCGTIPTPLNWPADNGDRIDARFAMVPGPSGAPLLAVNLGGPDPNLRNLILHGLNPKGLLWNELAAKFTLLFVEGRGSSMSSTPLVCPDAVLGQPYSTQVEYQNLVYECLANLPTKVSPALLTTTDQADDMDLVRAALGVDKMLLYGASYGTRLMFEYLRRHEAHVERYLLDSVLPPESTCKHDIDRTLETMCADCDAFPATCPFASGQALHDATNAFLNGPPGDDDDDTATAPALTLDLFDLGDQPAQLAKWPAALAAGAAAVATWHEQALNVEPAPGELGTNWTTFVFDPYQDNLLCIEFPTWNVFSDRTFVLNQLHPPYVSFSQIEWITNIDCASLNGTFQGVSPRVDHTPIVSAALGLMISPRLDQNTPYTDATAAIAAGLTGAIDVPVNCDHAILTRLGESGIGLSVADQNCLRGLAADWLAAPFDPTTRPCVNDLMKPLPLGGK